MRLADLNTGLLEEREWQWADLVLISAMHIQKTGFLDLVREAKYRGKTVVVGGPYPTSSPGEVLEAGSDYVVRGEGENTIPLLLEAMRDGNTRVIENDKKPDLTASPIPRFDLLRLKDYRAFAIQTSRGCPFDCEFCEVVKLFGHKVRYKTANQVIAELETLYRLGARGLVFICDDNFIGSKRHARDLLEELIPWLQLRGEPFNFITQAPVNLGQDLEMMNLMTAADFNRVFIGIESPDENVLETINKFQCLRHPLVESLKNLKQNGIEVIGSFIIGLDGEKQGVGERICAFIEHTSLPVAMVNILQAPPYSNLWHRLQKEKRLRGDVEFDGGGNFSGMNFQPDRPEVEIFQEYIEAWDCLYEPSHFLERVFRYYLSMPPVHRRMHNVSESSLPKDQVHDQGMTRRWILTEIKALLRILWWQGVRASYRRQFWRQLFGMLRENPTRFIMYIRTCAMGLDLVPMRSMVREQITALIKERKMETPCRRR